MATITQITKKLTAAGIPLDGITINPNEVEVTVESKDGECDQRRTASLVRKVCKALGTTWGGYKTGWGGWVLKEGYHGDTGDWNDLASRCHY